MLESDACWRSSTVAPTYPTTATAIAVSSPPTGCRTMLALSHGSLCRFSMLHPSQAVRPSARFDRPVVSHRRVVGVDFGGERLSLVRSEEHTSELQSRVD